MTNPTQNDRPIVKNLFKELYTEHTFHMSRAAKYTYNYAQLDDYIVRHWQDKTIKQIASDTNEYSQRVEYRIQVLKELGLIKGKSTGKTALIKQQRELRVQLRKIEQELKALG